MNGNNYIVTNLTGDPTVIPVENLKVSEKVVILKAWLSGFDVGNPDVEITTSTGWSEKLTPWEEAKTVKVPIDANGEMIFAKIGNYTPGKQWATVASGDRVLQVKANFADFAVSFQQVATAINDLTQGIGIFLRNLSAGWEFTYKLNPKPKLTGSVLGEVSIAPDDSIDGGSVGVAGDVAVSGIAEAYYGLPGHLLGVSGSLTVTVDLHFGVTASWTPGQGLIFTGDVTPRFEDTLAGNVYAFPLKGVIAGTVGVQFPIKVSSNGMASGGMDTYGRAEAYIQCLDKGNYVNVMPPFRLPYGPYHVTDWSYNLANLVGQAVQKSKEGGGSAAPSDALEAALASSESVVSAAGPSYLGQPDSPLYAAENMPGSANPAVVASRLVITTQPPSTVTAGAPFGLVVKAEDGLGNVDASFNGTVTLSDFQPDHTLGGTAAVTAVGGVATFSGLTLDQADSYSNEEYLDVSALGSTLSDEYTNNFTVVAATASQLAFSYGVENPQAGSKFSAWRWPRILMETWSPNSVVR